MIRTRNSLSPWEAPTQSVACGTPMKSQVVLKQPWIEHKKGPSGMTEDDFYVEENLTSPLK